MRKTQPLSLRAPCRAAGFTLLETAIGVGLLSVIAVIVGNVLRSSTNALDYLTTGSMNEQQVKNAMRRLTEDLQESAQSVVSATSASANDTLAIQRPNPTSGGSPAWGAYGSDGAWYGNHSTRYEVASGRLVRRLYNNGGVAVSSPAEESLVLNLATGGAGATKGFTVTVNGPVVNVQLCTSRTQKDGNTITKAMSTSVYLKNS